MIKVKIDPGKPVDYFIRLFNRKVAAEGIINEVQDRKFFVKPSQKKQLMLKERARKIKQRNRLQQYS